MQLHLELHARAGICSRVSGFKIQPQLHHRRLLAESMKFTGAFKQTRIYLRVQRLTAPWGFEIHKYIYVHAEAAAVDTGALAAKRPSPNYQIYKYITIIRKIHIITHICKYI